MLADIEVGSNVALSLAGVHHGNGFVLLLDRQDRVGAAASFGEFDLLIWCEVMLALVVCLLDRRRPPAVIFEISETWVFPVQRSARWPWPHVGEEALKAGHVVFAKPPAIAHGNAESTVVTERGILRVVTSADHVCVDRIFWPLCIASIACRDQRAFHAAAGARLTFNQSLCLQFFDGAALTTGDPSA